MSEKVLLKDQLFNAETIGQLGREFAAALPGFDSDAFTRATLDGFSNRELLARLDWIADCLEPWLPKDFPEMAEALEAAMPPPLSADKSDDDFGQFIHAVPGILAVRHGLEHHRIRAMRLLHEATRRFSMEFYIRPFLNRWPDETLADLHIWADEPHYHVRRLVSEGTRPNLPWARAVRLDPDQTLPLLDKLQGDPTRFVTRSVANHLNDLSKSDTDLVVDRLEQWRTADRQMRSELEWMRRHALRTAVKAGHMGALAALGYCGDVPVEARLTIETDPVRIGESLRFTITLAADVALPVMVDYRIGFARPSGRPAEKVFKLKQAKLRAGENLKFEKSHFLKADASTFTWYPGRHRITVQINGVDRAHAEFEVL